MAGSKTKVLPNQYFQNSAAAQEVFSCCCGCCFHLYFNELLIKKNKFIGVCWFWCLNHTSIYPCFPGAFQKVLTPLVSNSGMQYNPGEGSISAAMPLPEKPLHKTQVSGFL